MTAMLPIHRDEPAWESSDAFRDGMRRLASGVSLLTTGPSTAPQGLVATAVCSVSVDPPTLLACINRTASAYATIATSGRFAVNVLSMSHHDIVEQFSRPDRRADRFQSGHWRSNGDGPLLLADAIAVFDCLLVEKLHYATHTIFLARPLQVTIGEDRPLVHFNRQFHDL